MRNKKMVTFTMAACMMTGLVAGCGAKNADTASKAETAAESSTEESKQAETEESKADEAKTDGAEEAYERLPLP